MPFLLAIQSPFHTLNDFRQHGCLVVTKSGRHLRPLAFRPTLAGGLALSDIKHVITVHNPRQKKSRRAEKILPISDGIFRFTSKDERTELWVGEKL
jgi:hypothetical protein